MYCIIISVIDISIFYSKILIWVQGFILKKCVACFMNNHVFSKNCEIRGLSDSKPKQSQEFWLSKSFQRTTIPETLGNGTKIVGTVPGF